MHRFRAVESTIKVCICLHWFRAHQLHARWQSTYIQSDFNLRKRFAVNRMEVIKTMHSSNKKKLICTTNRCKKAFHYTYGWAKWTRLSIYFTSQQIIYIEVTVVIKWILPTINWCNDTWKPLKLTHKYIYWTHKNILCVSKPLASMDKFNIKYRLIRFCAINISIFQIKLCYKSVWKFIGNTHHGWNHEETAVCHKNYFWNFVSNTTWDSYDFISFSSNRLLFWKEPE